MGRTRRWAHCARLVRQPPAPEGSRRLLRSALMPQQVQAREKLRRSIAGQRRHPSVCGCPPPCCARLRRSAPETQHSLGAAGSHLPRRCSPPRRTTVECERSATATETSGGAPLALAAAANTHARAALPCCCTSNHARTFPNSAPTRATFHAVPQRTRAPPTQRSNCREATSRVERQQAPVLRWAGGDGHQTPPLLGSRAELLRCAHC